MRRVLVLVLGLTALFGCGNQDRQETPMWDVVSPLTEEERALLPPEVRFADWPFRAYVADADSAVKRYIPVVFDGINNCGVGLFWPSGDSLDGIIWGLFTPRDLITAWRATEVLSRLDSIENGTLCAAYYTGKRNPHASDKESYVDPMIAKIGEGRYDEIMQKPIPEAIVRAILDGQGKDFAPDTYPITDEVRAGTIEWRQEFADAGIEHPDSVDARERRHGAAIKEFESLLSPYAEHLGLPRKCFGMYAVERALATLVDKGADRSHPDYVVVALAGVAGELGSSVFSMFLAPMARSEYQEYMEERTEEAIASSAQWLSEESRRPVHLWERRRRAISIEEANQLLRQLLEEYFPQESSTSANSV